MDWVQVVALSVLQGLTEFLPISSSAHLILLPLLSDWPDQGLAFDVAVHVGTLVAVIGYFRRDLARMLRDWLRSLGERRSVGESRLVWFLLVGTVPVAVAGLVLVAIDDQMMRSALVIATATVLFAVALWWTDFHMRGERRESDLRWRDVLVIGAAQALALIPGTSRSGVVITAGLALGMSRESAARFSFLLSIPVIALAGGVKTLQASLGDVPVAWDAMALGTLLSALCAFACIHWFLKLVERIGVLPFVIYRLVLGALLFAFVV